MPAGFPDCPGCQRYRFPGLNVDFGFPDCPSLNLLSFAIGFTLSSFVPATFGCGSRGITARYEERSRRVQGGHPPRMECLAQVDMVSCTRNSWVRAGVSL